MVITTEIDASPRMTQPLPHRISFLSGRQAGNSRCEITFKFSRKENDFPLKFPNLEINIVRDPTTGIVDDDVQESPFSQVLFAVKDHVRSGHTLSSSTYETVTAQTESNDTVPRACALRGVRSLKTGCVLLLFYFRLFSGRPSMPNEKHEKRSIYL
jgi:hypothetical protein